MPRLLLCEQWYDPSKGYGFLTMHALSPGEKRRDIFVHASGLCVGGICISLVKDEQLEFRIAKSLSNEREKATHVTGPDAASLHETHSQPPAAAEAWTYLFDELFSP